MTDTGTNPGGERLQEGLAQSGHDCEILSTVVGLVDGPNEVHL